ncbi:MAG TPA: fumarylacetoacetate hydrolase family protein [Solirubrobacterales bacterium]
MPEPFADVMMRLRGTEAPGSLLFVGMNYRDHQTEAPLPIPSEPAFWGKLPNAVIGDGDPIVLPADRPSRFDYEGELAVVIGERAKHLSEADALDCVYGYTIVNDVTDRGVQLDQGQLILGKGGDGCCPIGPVVAAREELPDPDQLTITTTVNGEVRQHSGTSALVFSVPELLAFVTRYVTLRPGDVISTGTPAGCGAFLHPPSYLQSGDRVTVEIGGIGRLSNPVAAA